MIRVLVVGLAVLLGALAPTPTHAWHKRTPAVLQITPSNPGAVQNPRWAGFRYVLFDTDTAILGDNSQGRQVYYFDLQERDKALKQDPETTNLAIHRLTSGAGDYQHASAGMRATLIVLDGRVDGVVPLQIFLYNRTGGLPSALTQGSDDSMNARMDDGSRVVVFESKADLLGLGFGGTQIYRIDLKLADPACPYPCPANGNAGLTQVTKKAGTSGDAVLNKGGRIIVFESDANLLNNGQTETQIYEFDLASATTTALSHGPGASRNPTLSRSGGAVVFESDADLSSPPVGGTQIYLHRDSVAALQRLTSAVGGHSVRPAMESNGRALIFISTDDLLGNGSSGPEVFGYDIERGTLSQITNVPGSTGDPTYSAGVFTSFLSDGDLAGTGNSHPSLFLVNLFALGSGTLP